MNISHKLIKKLKSLSFVYIGGFFRASTGFDVGAGAELFLVLFATKWREIDTRFSQVDAQK